MGGNIVCCFDSGDRLLAQTTKITAQTGGLTLAASSGFPGTTPVPGLEKMSFYGKASEIDYGHGRGKGVYRPLISGWTNADGDVDGAPDDRSKANGCIRHRGLEPESQW